MSETKITSNEIAASYTEGNVQTTGSTITGPITSSSTFSGTSFIGDTTTMSYILDGGGSVISSGSAGSVEVPHDYTPLSWNLFSNLSGSLTVDVRRATYASWSGTGTLTPGNSIVGSEKPTITTSFKGQDASLTSWSGLSAGDILDFWVDSPPTNITRATLSITFRKDS